MAFMDWWCDYGGLKERARLALDRFFIQHLQTWSFVYTYSLFVYEPIIKPCNVN